jgi:hypothetical protein
MRSLVLLSIGLSVVACTSSTAPSAWQKPGADQQTTAGDSLACRDRARAEALQRYPYRGGSGIGGAGGVTMQAQIDDADRTTWEAGRFNACMRERGYQLSR